MGEGGIEGAIDGAEDVGAAEEGVDFAAPDLKTRAAGTNIGHRHLAVTATKDAGETATLDNGEHIIGIGCVTTAEEVLNGVVAAVDMHGSTLLRSRPVVFRTVVGLVTATEDIL